MKKTDIVETALSFSPRRAKRAISAIWEEARRMDSDAVRAAVDSAAALLREAGIGDVRVVDIPADGKTTAGGWIMPPLWTVKTAVLEAAGADAASPYADYTADPQSIALYSPGTPQSGVEGELVVMPEEDNGTPLDRLKSIGARLRGRFVLLPKKAATPELNEAVARRGGLGLIVVHPGPLRNAGMYLNYAVSLAVNAACVPVFSLSHTNGQRLRRDAATPGFRLRASVQAHRCAGSQPMLTGSVGSGGPPVYVCAHIDEIGALDNASGVGVAIEALRVLQQRSQTDGAKPLRQIRFYFSSEIRGLQWWFNHRERRARFLGGINLDMVGGDPAQTGRMQVLTGFRHAPHFSGRVLLDAVRLAERHVGGVPWKRGANFISDAIPQALTHGGHVSLEQETDRAYHSSADTPDRLRLNALKWAGTAATAYLAMMTRYDNADLLRLARRIRRQDQRQGPGQNRDARHRQRVRRDRELTSLLDGISSTNLYPDFTSPAEFYAAGVNRRTGLWPVIKTAAALKTALNDSASARDGRDATALTDLAPCTTFKGYPAFEDLRSARGRRELADRTGLAPGWGTPAWAWILATSCGGKRSLPRILDDLQDMGVNIDPAKAEAFVRYLADHGKMQLRPVLDADRLRKELRACGIRRGRILMAHVSLSQFGYVVGGAGTLLDVLLDLVGPKGALVLPTHSNSVLGAAPYDPRRSPANTGVVTEYFRKQPGVVRSPHPTHSVAAFGPAARELCEAHAPMRAPLSRDGFWGRLYEMNGDVLLMCPLSSATIFHVGETWLGLPQKPLVAHWLEGGRRRVATLPNGPWHVDHFEPTMARPLLRSGVMRRVPLGDSEVHVGPARAMCDISVRVLKRDPLVMIPRTCTCGYCRTLRDGLAAGLRSDESAGI